MLRSRKALSPVIASVILLAVVITVALVTVGWMTGLTDSFINVEELIVTNQQWSSSYVDLTVENQGTSPITITSASVNQISASFSFISGSDTIVSGETATIRVTEAFVENTKYSVTLTSSNSIPFSYYLEANSLTSVFSMEWGSVNASDSFVTINLANTYVNPVIVCSPQYDSGYPRTVRLTDVSSTNFKVKAQNPSGEVLPDTLIHYLVVEEGVWNSPFKMEAKKHNTNTTGENNNWRYDTLDYNQTYSGKLVVLHQVMSNNDPSWISSYVSRVNSRTNPPSSSDSGFRLALNGAEAVNSHLEETIGYIIMEEEFGLVDDIQFESKQSSDSVSGFGNSPPYFTSFSQSFSKVPSVVLVNHLEVDGSDGGWGVVYSVSGSQVGLCIDEDQVRDSERSHTTETCGFLVFQQPGAYLE